MYTGNGSYGFGGRGLRSPRKEMPLPSPLEPSSPRWVSYFPSRLTRGCCPSSLSVPLATTGLPHATPWQPPSPRHLGQAPSARGLPGAPGRSPSSPRPRRGRSPEAATPLPFSQRPSRFPFPGAPACPCRRPRRREPIRGRREGAGPRFKSIVRSPGRREPAAKAGGGAGARGQVTGAGPQPAFGLRAHRHARAQRGYCRGACASARPPS